MSSTERSSKTSAAPAKETSATVGARLTLKQATRAHLETSLGKRKGATTARSAAKASFFPNSARPKALTGLLGLSTCNSGFLSNLLADVAKAKQEIIQAKRAEGAQDFLSSVSQVSPAVKRRRISMSSNGSLSPVAQLNRPLMNNGKPQDPSSFLDLLWEESWLAPPVLNPRPVQALAPRVAPVPQRATVIPATVSETFEPQEDTGPLPSRKSAPPTQAEDNSFGWFVDMDDDDYAMIDDSHRHALNPYATKGSTDSLAFTAPTAPKASNYDAEIEWAKAADTVDDVLGDLF